MTDVERPRTSTRDPDVLRAALAGWLAARFPGAALHSLTVPTSNGMSSETVLFDADVPGTDVRRFVARIEPDPAALPVFPAYDLEKQFRVMRLVAEQSAVPVPRVLWYEPDRAALGSTFFVMERVDGDVPPDVMPYPMGSWLSEATPEDQRRLQRASVALLADLHALDPGEFAFLAFHQPGDTPLRRHVEEQRAYYEWLCHDGPRVPLVERLFAWLDEHWPRWEGNPVLSWGDARIGNVLYRDFTPVAVLDWEMVGLAPREVDLAWMVWMHTFLQDFAVLAGMRGMPDFMRLDEVALTYEWLTGYWPNDLDWYLRYAALRQSLVLARTAQRQLHFGEIPLPADPDDLVINRASVAALLP